MDTNDAVNPELSELLQRESDRLPAVDVRPVGPVQVQNLPAKYGYSRKVAVTNVVDSIEIIPEDPRRAYITFMVTGSPVLIGHDKQSVINGTAAELPTQRDLTLCTSAPIYIICTNAGPATVNYWVGQWAD